MRTVDLRGFAIGLSLVLLGGQVEAQIREVPEDSPRPRSILQGGGHLDLALPQGDFARFVSAGYGLGLWGGINLDRRGQVMLKLDGSYLIYGSETRSRPLSPTVPFVTVDVTTQNNIYVLGLGPQFTLSTGALRPYVAGMVGFSYFVTESSVRGSNNTESFAQSTNFSDFTLAWMAGAGLKIRLRGGRTPIFLDLSGEYHRNGEVKYLREGSITDNGNGGITIRPIQSQTNLVLIKAGVSAGW